MRTSATQFQLMVEFMERNGDLSKPTDGPQGRMKNIQSWVKLTEMLNADSTGDTKSTEKWRKVWSDMKNNTKKKAARILRDATGTGGGPACKLKLNDLEQRILNILGPQAASGIPEIVEVGFYPQEDFQPSSPSVLVQSQDSGATENNFIMWSLRGASGQPAQQPQDDHPGSPPGIDVEVPAVENRLPTPEVPQTATPLPQTPRRRRRFVQAVLSPSRRRTRMQTQSELARQAFVNSDNEWRVFQRQCEEERLRLRERELNQQERWLELFAQMIALGNRIADTLK